MSERVQYLCVFLLFLLRKAVFSRFVRISVTYMYMYVYRIIHTPHTNKHTHTATHAIFIQEFVLIN